MNKLKLRRRLLHGGHIETPEDQVCQQTESRSEARLIAEYILHQRTRSQQVRNDVIEVGDLLLVDVVGYQGGDLLELAG